MKTMERGSLKDDNGSYRVGEIDISYSKLVELFGKHDCFDNYKSDAEWIVKYGNEVFTIYNYKDGKNYLGEDGKNVEEIRDWYIGGKTNADEFIKALQH